MKSSPVLRQINRALACFLLAVHAFSATTKPLASDPSAPAVIDQKDPRYAHFLQRHAAILQRAKAGPIGILFLGDSITERWEIAPQVWAKYYGDHQPANFGIGGDTTQGVLWRIAHRELDGIHPRIVVLLLGTNNVSQGCSADQIAAADSKIVRLIRAKLPDTKILLLAIFPRGPRKSSDGSFDDGPKHMPVIRAANAELARLDDGQNIRFLDIGAKFYGPEGKIPDAVMADQLHPTVAGYEIWAKAMQPMLQSLAVAQTDPVRTGTQDFRNLAPSDVAPGRIVLPGTVVYGASDRSWIRFKPESAWGWVSYRVTRISSEPPGDPAAEVSLPLSAGAVRSSAILWRDANTDEYRPRLWLEGEITAVQPGGETWEGIFRFKGERLRLRFEMLDSQMEGPSPGPTFRNVAYGPDFNQRMDVYLAQSAGPAPVAVYFHPGGWIEGDKSDISQYQALLDVGITVVAVNYRFCPKQNPDDSMPAVAVPLGDAARAVQFIRSRAKEWGLNKKRLGVWGISAGAASSLWLATHPDMADPRSSDGVGVESTRPRCAVGILAQTSLDPAQMRAWVGPGLDYGAHAFGFADPAGPKASFERFLTARPRLLPWIRAYSPAALLQPGDPPIFLDYRDYTLTPDVPTYGYYAHSPGFGIGFSEMSRRLGNECYLRYRGREATRYFTWQAFMIAKLTE